MWISRCGEGSRHGGSVSDSGSACSGEVKARRTAAIRVFLVSGFPIRQPITRPHKVDAVLDVAAARRSCEVGIVLGQGALITAEIALERDVTSCLNAVYDVVTCTVGQRALVVAARTAAESTLLA